MNQYSPLSSFNFWISFELSDSPIDLAFQEISGIRMELQSEHILEGGENRYIQKLPLQSSFSPLVLKRGLAVNSKLMDWARDAIENLNIRPATILVALLNEKQEPLITYRFMNSYPLKWSISNFNAESNITVIESLELYYEYFNIIK